MANKQTHKTTGEPSKFISFLKSNKLRYACIVALGLFGIFLFVAFLSFLFTGAADQSKLHVTTNELMQDPNLGVKNGAGQSGASLSYLFINKGFGIASFFFIYIIAITILQLLHFNKFNYWKHLFLSALGLLWISTTLGLIIPFANDSFHLGGKTGLYLANIMSTKFGLIGSILLLLGFLVLTLIFAFDQFIPWVGRMKNTLFPEKIRTEKEQAKSDALFTDNDSIDNDNINDEDYESYDTDDAGEFNVFEKQNEVEEEILNERVDVEKLSINKDKELLIDENLELPIDKNVTVFEIDDEEEEEEEIEEERIPVTPYTPEVTPEHTIIDPNDTSEVGIVIEKNAEEELIHASGSVASLSEAYDPTLDLSHYKFPTIDLLEDHQKEKHDVSEEELIENKNKIVETLSHYKIEIVKIRATIGPTITLYEIVPAPGTRVNRIKNLEDDIALSLAALGVRIIAPIPGKGTIGIEVPNKKPEVVSMRSIVASKRFQESTADLPIVMGKTITNETFVFDLAKMPHLLVAGATGQGKSVGLNAIITSLLYKMHPSQLKMVMVDPKMVELNIYGVIEKHFLAKLPDADKPIITDVDKVKNTLNSLTIEMDERYKLLMTANARNIKEYNAKFTARLLNPKNGHKFLPYIVVVVDEFADLIMTAGKEIETPIARIAQKARAVGMHMIIATQRPSTNIITGVIKANFPGRIAFRVASMIDSRTILDSPGANQLIGKGDMLFMQGSDMIRLQCAFVDTPEVERVCEFIANQQGYPSAFLLPEYVPENEGGGIDVDMNQRDELFDEVARMVVSNQMGSTSMIQRKFAIGYNRAGRIMDQLEAAGVVGPSEGSKARQVLLHDDYALEQLLNRL